MMNGQSGNQEKMAGLLFHTWYRVIEECVQAPIPDILQSTDRRSRIINLVFNRQAKPQLSTEPLKAALTVADKWLMHGVFDDDALKALVKTDKAFRRMKPALRKMAAKGLIGEQGGGTPMWVAAFAYAQSLTELMLQWNEDGKMKDASWRENILKDKAVGDLVATTFYPGIKAPD